MKCLGCGLPLSDKDYSHKGCVHDDDQSHIKYDEPKTYEQILLETDYSRLMDKYGASPDARVPGRGSFHRVDDIPIYVKKHLRFEEYAYRKHDEN